MAASETRLRQGEPDDATLMERVHRGDHSAFEIIVTRYWSLLVPYAARLLSDAAAAKDVVQEALIRVWSHRREWRPGPPRTFLYRLTRNLALDELRRRRVRERWTEDMRGMREQEALEAPGPGELVEEKELIAIVERAIAALPERRREVFTLAYRHGFTYEEIAELMGVARQTVANQMSAALAEVRRTVEPFLENGSTHSQGSLPLAAPRTDSARVRPARGR